MKLRSFLSQPALFDLFNALIGEPASQKILISRYLSPQPGGRILDMGCGTADILSILPSIDYVGFDPEASYISAAKKRYGSRGQFHCAGVSEINGADLGLFDLVLAKGVLHHLDDAQARVLLQLARKVLRPGGKLVTIDGCFTENQSIVTQWLLKSDRGNYVRTEPAYRALADVHFSRVESHLHDDLLRIPYTHLIMTCHP